MNLKPLLKGGRVWAKKHLPSILIATGVGGMFTSVIFAVKATPKAKEKLDERKEELGVETLPVLEVVKTAGPCYIPAAFSFGVGAACVFVADHAYTKQLGSAMMLTTMAEKALKDYKDKTLEVVGPKKQQEIEQKVSEAEVSRHPIPDYATIPHLQNGTTLCYDPYSSRYFYHDPEKIKQALTRLSMRMRNGSDRCISLNDYYYEIGLSSAILGDMLGWYEDQRTLVKGEIAPDFQYLSIDNGPPIWVLKFATPPERDFDKVL